MKKGIVILLVALAVIVLLTPGIVGRLAEKSVDDSLRRASEQTREVEVTSQSYRRGWFSSEGRHRVEIVDETVGEAVLQALGYEDDSAVPPLIVDTRIDHGIIPVSSMTRDKGSLAPGLGSAISTLSVETPDGEVVPLPGTIYSSIGLTGELESNLVLEAGSFTKDDATVHWGDADINVTMRPDSAAINYDGTIATLSVAGEGRTADIAGITFVGDGRPSDYGITLGSTQLDFERLTVQHAMREPDTGGPFSVFVDISIDDESISTGAMFSMQNVILPGVGVVNLTLDFGMAGIDAEALGGLADAVDALPPDEEDPQVLMSAIEEPLKDLLSLGLRFDIRQLDIELPQGAITTRLEAVVDERDRSDFAWASLLLATEGNAEIRVPKEVMDLVLAMNPQAGAAIGMGFLKLNGDVYELIAEYRKGLLTINGAPMPVPLPGRQP